MKKLSLLFFAAIPFFVNGMQEFEEFLSRSSVKTKNTGFEQAFVNSLREESRKKSELWEAYLKQQNTLVYKSNTPIRLQPEKKPENNDQKSNQGTYHRGHHQESKL